MQHSNSPNFNTQILLTLIWVLKKKERKKKTNNILNNASKSNLYMSMSSCHSNKIHTQLEVIKMKILIFTVVPPLIKPLPSLAMPLIMPYCRCTQIEILVNCPPRERSSPNQAIFSLQKVWPYKRGTTVFIYWNILN